MWFHLSFHPVAGKDGDYIATNLIHEIVINPIDFHTKTRHSSFGARAARQVNELLTECSGSRFANSDRTLLEAPVQLRDGRLIGLLISLPPGFPDVAPSLRVNQPVPHSCVDTNGSVMLPALRNWSPSYTLKALVRTVQAAFVGESIQYPGIPANQKRRPYPTGLSGAPQGVSAVPHAVSTQHPMDPNPAVIAEILNSMSIANLESCLLFPEAFQKLAATVAGKLQTSQATDQLRNQNMAIAKENLSREKEVDELVNQVAIIKSTEFADARRDYEEKVFKQKEIVGKISIPQMIGAMHESAKEVDAQSDELQGSFMEKGVKLEDFCQEYHALRVKYYTKELIAQAAVTRR